MENRYKMPVKPNVRHSFRFVIGSTGVPKAIIDLTSGPSLTVD